MSPPSANEENRRAWDANARFWDGQMGEEGNAFFRLLHWPAAARLLEVQPGQRILDAACGNGLTSRKLASLGAEVTAFDFSEPMIRIAEERSREAAAARIHYRLLDATDEDALLTLGVGRFDAALCSMALFDIPDIRPLFRALARLLRPGAPFVFSLTHPAFNSSSAVRVTEVVDDQGEIRVIRSMKVSQYMTSRTARGLAIVGQPEPQVYFDRPLQEYLQLGFANGFVLDGFEEPVFPPDQAPANPQGLGGPFTEIPPVLVARLRRRA